MFPATQYTTGRRLAPHGIQQTEKEWPQNDIAFTARVVCADCNNGWMSLVEENTIPILRPMIASPLVTRRLSKQNQSILATWAALRSMVFDRSRGDKTYYSPEELRGFSNSPAKPLPNTHVWLATLPSVAPKGVAGQIHIRADENRAVGYQVFNCLIGQVAFQLLHWKGFNGPKLISNSSPNIINLRKLTHSIWRQTTLQIWPHSSKSLANWPPRTLDAKNVPVFLNRFVI